MQIFLPATSFGLVDTAHYFCRVIIAILASASATLLTVGAAYSPSIAADGVVKLNHISKCGRACKKQEPFLHSFYGEPNATVTERAAEACLNLASCMQVNPGEDGDDNGYDSDEDADDNTGCSASVTCARISCVAKGICDVYGVVGAVCAHTIPVVGSFMDLLTPEQYVYYIILLTWILLVAPQV